MPIPLLVGLRNLLACACLLTAAWTSPALAVSAGTAGLSASADCNANANLDVSWTGAGNHFEFGAAYDAAGSVIGTFGPDTNSNNDFSGEYKIPIATAQPAGALIGAYAWVGGNPPGQATAVEYFVVYNCSTRAVLYRCAGPFGSCANRVAAALAVLPFDPSTAPAVPVTSREMLVVLMLLLGGAGALRLRRCG
ncbi:MAG: hypothetical protein ABIS17_17230 [Casimicrobiaceae bacterium]